MLNTYWDPVMNKDQNDSSLQPLFLGVKQGEHELLTAQPWWVLLPGLCLASPVRVSTFRSMTAIVEAEQKWPFIFSGRAPLVTLHTQREL